MSSFKNTIQSKYAQKYSTAAPTKQPKKLPIESENVKKIRDSIYEWIKQYNLVKLIPLFTMQNSHYKASYKYMQPEEYLHIFCYQFLKAYHSKDVFVWHTENEGKRNTVRKCISQLMGLTEGISDLIIQRKGIENYPLLVIELKIKGNYPTSAQKEFLELQKSIGNDCHVIYDFPSFLEVFNKWFNQ